MEMLKQLRSAYKPPVTCFRDQDGVCQPLLGIWSPESLSRLAEHSKKGVSGAASIVEDLSGNVLEPPDNAERLLFQISSEPDCSREYPI